METYEIYNVSFLFLSYIVIYVYIKQIPYLLAEIVLNC